jgi:hypothetical protein
VNVYTFPKHGESETSEPSTSDSSLAVTESDRLKITAERLWNLGGMMSYLIGMMGDRIMCTKNGCKGHGNLVRSVSLVLCATHEAALDRVPEIRKLWKQKYRADIRTSAFAHGGNAELADVNAAKALDIEDQLLDAALTWSKEPDEEGPVKPTFDWTRP